LVTTNTVQRLQVQWPACAQHNRVSLFPDDKAGYKCPCLPFALFLTSTAPSAVTVGPLSFIIGREQDTSCKALLHPLFFFYPPSRREDPPIYHNHCHLS
jgi:hypothetical protein